MKCTVFISIVQGFLRYQKFIFPGAASVQDHRGDDLRGNICEERSEERARRDGDDCPGRHGQAEQWQDLLPPHPSHQLLQRQHSQDEQVAQQQGRPWQWIPTSEESWKALRRHVKKKSISTFLANGIVLRSTVTSFWKTSLVGVDEPL